MKASLAITDRDTKRNPAENRKKKNHTNVTKTAVCLQAVLVWPTDTPEVN